MYDNCAVVIELIDGDSWELSLRKIPIESFAKQLDGLTIL